MKSDHLRKYHDLSELGLMYIEVVIQVDQALFLAFHKVLMRLLLIILLQINQGTI